MTHGDGTRGDAGRPPASPTLLAVGVAVAVASVAWYLLRGWYPFGPPVLGWLPVPVNVVLAGVAARRTARHPGLNPATRRFWRQFAPSSAILVLALASSGYEMLRQPGRPVTPLTAGLYAATMLPPLWGLIRLPVTRQSPGEWLTIGLDAAIVAVAAGVVVRDVALRGGATSSVGDTVVWLSITAVTLVGVVVAVKLSHSRTALVDPRSLWALGSAVLAGAAASAGARYLVPRPGLHITMLAVPVVYVGLILAAHLQDRARVDPHPAPRRRRFNLLPYAAVAGAVLLLLTAVRGPAGPTVRFAVTGSVVLTALVIGRQLVVSFQNGVLLDRVDASLLELSRRERRFRSLIQNSDDIISIVDAGGNLVYNSPGMQRVLGLDPDAMTGVDGRPSVHPDDLPLVSSMFRDITGRPGASVRGQVRIQHADGSWRWFEVTYTNLLEDPSVRGVVSNARDITATRRYQDQLAYQATHDELTGLANRFLFAERTEQAVRRGAPGTVAVALVDLDDFKGINDRLGHAVGDALLVAVSGRLRVCMRPGDVVARLGGDEFAILMTGLGPDDSATIAERILEALEVPVQAAGHQLLVQASVGLVDGDRETDADDLLRRADLAMYSAKELGKNRYARYDAALEARAGEHAEVAAALTHALDRDELYLLYQPIVDLPSGRVAAAEALIRWAHPTDGAVSPLRFIPVAERTGLVVPLGTWVLRTACRQAASWRCRYGSAAPERISVNVSARQLLEPKFPQTVADILAETGLEPHRLTIEITETAVFGGGRAVEAVAALHAMGIGIALDDFGTGHSSLGLLRTCPVDVLKVDKSFVDGVTGTVEQEAIATSIVEIAQALGLRAIAEGVETGAQAVRLHALGYTLAQGFHFARPLRAAELEDMFRPVVAAA